MAKGWCNGHLLQLRGNKKLKPITKRAKVGEGSSMCSFGGCGRKSHAKSLCKTHHIQHLRGKELSPIWLPNKNPCKVPNCGRKHQAKGYCSHHWRKFCQKPSNKIVGIRSALKHKYNITFETYDELRNKQNGVCAVCKKVCKSGKRLSVDHNHSTGRIRGLLCGKCNTALGLAEDSIERLYALIAYLKLHEPA